MAKKLSLSLFILSILFGCAPKTARLFEPVGSSPSSVPPPSTSLSTATTAPVPDGTAPKLALFITPHAESKVEDILKILKQNENLRVTFLFPTDYFDKEPRRSQLSQFRVLQSSKQIEIGLTLGNDPILPLLANLKQAGDKTSKWPFTFAWPDDIAVHVAYGSGYYQKRWGQLPSGFYPPSSALSDDVVEILRRFRVNWVMGKAQEMWGVRYYGGTALLVPPTVPTTGVDEEGFQNLDLSDVVNWTFSTSFVHVDFSAFKDPDLETKYLERISQAMRKHPDHQLMTGQQFSESLRDEHALPKDANPFEFDYTPWVATNQQRRAWQALSEARSVIETYKDSGRANLQRLDAALEEMRVAEGGTFLLSLGIETATPVTINNFLATLANIYRLTGTPLPPNLNNWFADRSYQKFSSKPLENDRPFFVEGPDSLTWNDPQSDDKGNGKFTYPAGKYPKGAFDLREFNVNWTDEDVTFSIGVIDMPSLQQVNVVPFADIYIDVNRLAGAGSLSVLRKRGTAVIDRQAAWENVIALSPYFASIYQPVPGNPPRLVMMLPAKVENNSMSVTISRSLLRGDPHRWRFVVALMGTENLRKKEERSPVSVTATASEKSFGGASGGRTAIPFIDILNDSAADQFQRLSGYESGETITLPFVEAP